MQHSWHSSMRFLLGTLIALPVTFFGISQSHALTVTEFHAQNTNPSTLGGYHFEIEFDTPINPYTDEIRIDFPWTIKGDIDRSIEVEVAGTDITGLYDDYIGLNYVAFILATEEGSIPAGTPIQVYLSGISNPIATGTYTIEISVEDAESVLDAGEAEVTITSNLSIEHVELSNYNRGAEDVTYAIQVLPTGTYGSGYLGIHFPEGASFSSVLNDDISFDGSNPAWNQNLTDISIHEIYRDMLILEITSSTPNTSGIIAIQIANVDNPNATPYEPLGVAWYESFDATAAAIFPWDVVHTPTAGGSTAMAFQGIKNATTQLSDTTTLATGVTYDINFFYQDTNTFNDGGIFWGQHIPTTKPVLVASTNIDTLHPSRILLSQAMTGGDTIVLTFPAAVDISNVTNSDVSISGGTLIKDTATVNGQELTISIASGELENEEISIQIANVTNPDNASITYPIQIALYEGGITLFSTGTVYFSLGGVTVPPSTSSLTEVSALVTEALILTLNGNAVNLIADPNENDGINRSQYTQLSVYSNSPSGYVLSALLSGAQLTRQGGGGAIPSGTGDGTFGYHATNTAYDAMYTFTGDHGFSGTETLLEDSSNNPIGHNTVADPVHHTVYYDLDVNFLTPAGTYTGLIYYTVTAAF